MNEGLPPVTAGAKRGIIGGGIGTGAVAGVNSRQIYKILMPIALHLGLVT
jgi:ABC-type arginine/histidine transport system permease subunit